MRARASIIVPLLNQVDSWLKKAVLSALSQSIPCEVIVVASPRTKKSNLGLLFKLKKIHPNLEIVIPGERTFARAINIGFRTAVCERVGLLLSDDWLSPHAVEACLAHDKDIVSTSGRGYAADGKTVVMQIKAVEQKVYESKQTLEEKADYLRHFFVFKKAAVLAVGGVDETIGNTGPDDYDLIWTMLENGAGVGIVEGVFYNYRDHDGVRLTMRSCADQVRDLERILNKHGVHGEECQRLVKLKSVWFGRPVIEVKRELMGVKPALMTRVKRKVRRLLKGGVH